ncbi:MAG TPA: ThuA domain-containing protein [Hanamia sp.]|nr:ThuA domain-containing protein [Hanamia sp.]
MNKILRNALAILGLTAFLIVGCNEKRSGKPKVLVFTKTEGYHHASIADGVKAIQKLGAENNFEVDTTSNSEKFTEDSLKKYAAVIFLSTTGDVLDYRQQADFQRYIQAGGGYVGIHAATDCEYHWPWYGKLSGAYFVSHPEIQQATLDVKDKSFDGTRNLPDKWVRTDEWYNFRNFNKDVHVLITLDEKSYKGGTMGDFHPVVWYHDFDGGRAFYMELGHTSESYTEPNFLQLLVGGIKYALDNNERLDYSKVTTLRVPDEDRFSEKILSRGLDEPEQMAILPNKDILISERKGQLLFYKNGADSAIQIAQFNVYDKTHVANVNAEEGLLGIVADPKYTDNHWIYVYYSPVDKIVNRLSRFKFENGKWDMKSEQIILEVPTQREICCHTGGSLAFDSQGKLFLSVGDNTTPFDEVDPKTNKAYPYNSHGYAPLDDRPGYEHFDDRRAAGNSNDLRGKILRIIVKDDGTYQIPQGNLFPPGTAKTRPEIYVMGDRNPYRISIDQHTGYLYWGEVGPDADNDSLATRGPRGYDEINQARKAGNFGWPYLIGPNIPYHEYNYATGESGIAFNASAPVNNSRNNTGINILPPAQPAFIWYPYGASTDFPILGQGGRCAMAGPVYYAADYPKETRLPDYYNGKFFFYDWIRNWIMVATMDQQGNLQTIEPFMPMTKFHAPMDIKLGPDGKLYVLEYGTGWFTKNADAALVRIDYNPGNRSPVVSFNVNQAAGSLPFTVHLSAKGSRDPDGDNLSYEWNLGGVKKKTNTNELDYTFTKAGDYPVSVTVSDDKGAQASSDVVDVYAGNNIPRVSINISGNSTFYFPNKPVRYDVMVNDKEDGSSTQPGFDTKNIFVKASYLSAEDISNLSIGMKEQESSNPGQQMMLKLDCSSCHKVDEKSVGPAFTQVAAKYKNDPKAKDYLANKIIKGGSGVWGQVAMAAHPNLAVSDAEKIVSWVLSLASTKKEKSLPTSGTIIPSNYKLNDKGDLYIQASYTDKGGNGIKSLTGKTDAILNNPLVPAEKSEIIKGFSVQNFNDNNIYLSTDDNPVTILKNISLQDVTSVEIMYGLTDTLLHGWKLELHEDSQTGKLLGETTLGLKVATKKPATSVIQLSGIDNAKPHDLYFVFHKIDAADKGGLAILTYHFLAK